MVWVLFTGGTGTIGTMFLCTLFGDFSFPILVIIGTYILYSGLPPILLFQLFRGGLIH